jgi:hypothetical protein
MQEFHLKLWNGEKANSSEKPIPSTIQNDSSLWLRKLDATSPCHFQIFRLDKKEKPRLLRQVMVPDTYFLTSFLKYSSVCFLYTF